MPFIGAPEFSGESWFAPEITLPGWFDESLVESSSSSLKAHLFTEDWSDLTAWTGTGLASCSVANNQVSKTWESSTIRTVRTDIDLTNSSWTFEVRQRATSGWDSNADLWFVISPETYSELMKFDLHGSIIDPYISTVGAGTPVTYDPAIHRFFRFRHSGSTAYIEVSADAQSWTVLQSATAPAGLNAVQPRLAGQAVNGGTATGTTILGPINPVVGNTTLTVTPTTAAAGSISGLGSATVITSPTVEAAGTPTRVGSVAVTPNAVAASAGDATKPAVTSVAPSTATAAAGVYTGIASTSVAMNPSLAAVGASSKPLNTSTAVSPAVASSASKTTPADAAVAQSPALVAAGYDTQFGTTSGVTPVAALSASGYVTKFGEATVATSPVAASDGTASTPTKYGDATTAPVVTVAAAGIISDYGNADLAVAPAVAAGLGAVSKSAVADLLASASTDATGQHTAVAGTSVTPEAVIGSSLGLVAKSASVSVTVDSALSASGVVTTFGVAVAAVSPTSSAAGYVTQFLSSDGVATSPVLESSGYATAIGTANVVASPSQTSNGSTAKPLAATVSVDAAPTAAGYVTDSGSAPVTASVVITAATTAAKAGTADVVVAPALSAAGEVARFASATLPVVPLVDASGTYVLVAMSDVPVVAVTSAEGTTTRFHFGVADLVITPYIQVATGVVTDHGDADFIVDALITVSGEAAKQSPTDTTVEPVIQATGLVTDTASADLAIAPETAVIGGKDIYGDVAVQFGAATTCEVSVLKTDDAQPAFVAVTDSAGESTKPLVVSLDLSPTLDADASMSRVEDSSVDVVVDLTADTTAYKYGDCDAVGGAGEYRSGETYQSDATYQGGGTIPAITLAPTIVASGDVGAVHQADAAVQVDATASAFGTVNDEADALIGVSVATDASAAIAVVADASLVVTPTTATTYLPLSYGDAALVGVVTTDASGAKEASSEAFVDPVVITAADVGAKAIGGETIVYPVLSTTADADMTRLGATALTVDAAASADGSAQKPLAVDAPIQVSIEVDSFVLESLRGDASLTVDAMAVVDGSLDKTAAVSLPVVPVVVAEATVQKWADAEIGAQADTQSVAVKYATGDTSITVTPEVMAYISGVIRHGDIALAVTPTITSQAGVIYTAGAVLVIDPVTDTELIRLTYGSANLDVELATLVLAERIGVAHADLLLWLEALASGDAHISAEAALAIQNAIEASGVDHAAFKGWGVGI